MKFNSWWEHHGKPIWLQTKSVKDVAAEAWLGALARASELAHSCGRDLYAPAIGDDIDNERAVPPMKANAGTPVPCETEKP